MKLIGQIQKGKFEKSKLKIDIRKFHRFATGAVSGTKLFIFPRLTEDLLDNDKKIKEIVISQYPPIFWGNIFRLKFWLVDKPGITKDIFCFLEKFHINIETQESIMTRANSVFTISIIADFYEFYKNESKHLTNDDRVIIEETIKSKKDWIKQVFILKFDQFFKDNDNINTKTKPTIKTIELLNSNAKDFQDDNLVDEKYLTKVFNKKRYPKVIGNLKGKIGIQNGVVYLKQRDLKSIEIDVSKNIHYTINSDTEEKYILIRFFDERYIGQWDIRHKQETIGALASFLNHITNSGGNFNIISSYNRIEDFEEFSHWRVMIDCTYDKENVHKFIQEIENEEDVKITPLSFTSNLLNYLRTQNKLYLDFQENKSDVLENDNEIIENEVTKKTPIIENNININLDNSSTLTNTSESKSIGNDLKNLGIGKEYIKEFDNILSQTKESKPKRKLKIDEWFFKVSASLAAKGIYDVIPKLAMYITGFM